MGEEERRLIISRLERLGVMAQGCPGCKERYEAKNPLNVFAPRHTASDRCESGKRPHCSCDRCF